MARAPVSKTGGWGFESLHSCQAQRLKRLNRRLGPGKSGGRHYIEAGWNRT